MKSAAKIKLPKPEGKATLLNVRFKPTDVRKIAAEAKAADMTVSELIRSIVMEFLNAKEKEQ